MVLNRLFIKRMQDYILRLMLLTILMVTLNIDVITNNDVVHFIADMYSTTTGIVILIESLYCKLNLA